MVILCVYILQIQIIVHNMGKHWKLTSVLSFIYLQLTTICVKEPFYSVV